MRVYVQSLLATVGLRSAMIVAATAGLTVAASADITDIQGSFSTVKIVRGTDATSTSSTGFVDITGAQTTVKVKDTDTIVAVRFSAESYCAGPTAGNWCTIRIISTKGGVDTELRPATGTDFAFDSVEAGGNGYYSGHSMDRSIVLADKGKYTIRVQYAVTDPASSFRIDDWSMTVETGVATK